jgi:hypothetical protein
MENSISLNFVVVLHKLLVYFIAFGCILPVKYLPFHLIAWPSVYIHWKFNDNKCVLTQLEHWLKDGTCMKDAPKVGEKRDDDFYFAKKTLHDYSIDLSDEEVDKLIYIFFSLSWMISFYRYINSKS